MHITHTAASRVENPGFVLLAEALEEHFIRLKSSQRKAQKFFFFYINSTIINTLNQGSLTEGEGSVWLTSSHQQV
jgi:hypothetical protein